MARRSGGNLTDISIDAGSETWGKRLQIPKGSDPVGVENRAPGTSILVGIAPAERTRAASRRRRGIASFADQNVPERGHPQEIEHSFSVLVQQQPDAVLISLARREPLIIG